MTTVLAIVVEASGEGWVSSDEAILCTQVHIVEDLPVDITNSSGWMKESLESVEENSARSECNSESLNSIHDAVDHMG